MEQKLQIDQRRVKLQQQSGLDLPYWPRQVMWTLKALRLDWKADLGYSFLIPPGSLYPSRVRINTDRTRKKSGH